MYLSDLFRVRMVAQGHKERQDHLEIRESEVTRVPPERLDM